jgi:hypothetical protein
MVIESAVFDKLPVVLVVELNSFFVLQGGKPFKLYATDMDLLFR